MLDNVVVATADSPSSDPIETFCAENRIPCFRGSEDDVLGRIYHAAVAYNADTIVGITGDCPLHDPRVVDRVIREYQKYHADLCAVSPSFTYPNGFGTTVFPMDVIAQAHKEAKYDMEREHLTLFIQRHPERFKIRYVEYGSYHPFPDIHLSVDDEHDFKLVERVFLGLLPEKPLFSLEDIIDVLMKHPEWVAEHPQTPINEGYFKSLLVDESRPRPVIRENKVIISREMGARAHERLFSYHQKADTRFRPLSKGYTPLFVERGEGGMVYDADGNEFIDHSLASGGLTLGYCHPEVDEAAIAQVRKGNSYTLFHPLEVSLAERLCDLIPCAEMILFGITGSDAVTGTVDIARAVTGRQTVACCTHSFPENADSGIMTSDGMSLSSLQGPAVFFPYNDIDALQEILERHQIAAVIMEPVNVVLPQYGYLARVKEVAHRHGALLVFNEIGTGFRIDMGGAEQYFGVVPDMACFGEGMGNGYPISAVAGRKDIMKGAPLLAQTFRSGAVSLAAAHATLNIMERDNAVSHMWILGRKLKEGYNYLARRYKLDGITQCIGLPPKTKVLFKDDSNDLKKSYRRIFQDECLKRGVLFDGNHVQCLMRTDYQIEYTITVYNEAFQILRDACNSDDADHLSPL